MPAVAAAGPCKQVHAQIVSDPILGCAESPIGLCTSGRIAGNHGLRGTTFFAGDSAGESTATAPNPAATLSYSGTLEITTAKGTLALRDTGIFDQFTGLFSSFDVVETVNSTGRFAGVTGKLFIGGEIVGGQFVTTVITGGLCFP
jgi:hypothetical protein